MPVAVGSCNRKCPPTASAPNPAISNNSGSSATRDDADCAYEASAAKASAPFPIATMAAPAVTASRANPNLLTFLTLSTQPEPKRHTERARHRPQVSANKKRGAVVSGTPAGWLHQGAQTRSIFKKNRLQTPQEVEQVLLGGTIQVVEVRN